MNVHSDVQVMLHMFSTQFLYSRIIVETRIKTHFFAHIIVNAISPHVGSKYLLRYAHYAKILPHVSIVFVCPGLSPLVNYFLLIG